MPNLYRGTTLPEQLCIRVGDYKLPKLYDSEFRHNIVSRAPFEIHPTAQIGAAR